MSFVKKRYQTRVGRDRTEGRTEAQIEEKSRAEGRIDSPIQGLVEY